LDSAHSVSRFAELSQIQRISLVRQLVLSLSSLHSQGVVHGGLSPAVVGIKSSQVRLLCPALWPTFFADAKDEFIQHLIPPFCAHYAGWLPSEVFVAAGTRKSSSTIFTGAADIFALGCICFYLLQAGKHPFGREWER
jgi:serine/threonine protein kinase